METCFAVGNTTDRLNQVTRVDKTTRKEAAHSTEEKILKVSCIPLAVGASHSWKGMGVIRKHSNPPTHMLQQPSSPLREHKTLMGQKRPNYAKQALKQQITCKVGVHETRDADQSIEWNGIICIYRKYVDGTTSNQHQRSGKKYTAVEGGEYNCAVREHARYVNESGALKLYAKMRYIKANSAKPWM